MHFVPALISLGSLIVVLASPTSNQGMAKHSMANSTYLNPMLPGFNPDPSCVAVDGTFFCVTSTFLTFPGLPVYASKDLQNWRHISNVFHDQSQLPGLAIIPTQNGGVYAPTIRFREGIFYVLTTFVGDENGLSIVLFQSDNPFNSSSWSAPIRWFPEEQDFHFDPDLFWDEDGQAYVTAAYFVRYVGVGQYSIDLDTGKLGTAVNLWNGTGGFSPEGPRMFKRDDFYYLCVADGGTGLQHQQTIARSRNRIGPYESFAGNPIISNANTTEYFQTVGHNDFFQDLEGKWWSVALATRSGPEWTTFPMGRETSLLPVTWEAGQWPVLSPLQGQMTGWAFPPISHDLEGEGKWTKCGDKYTSFDSTIPPHFTTFRFAPRNSYSVENGRLRLSPSYSNLTGSNDIPQYQQGISFLGRRQTDTMFSFGVNMEFSPTSENEEAGITLFLTQNQHIDLSVVLQNNETYFHFRSISSGANNQTTGSSFDEHFIPIEDAVSDLKDIRLQADAVDASTFVLSVNQQAVASASANVVSGGEGQFMGTFAGVFSTSNGGNSSSPAYFTNWTYTPIAQQLDFGVVVKTDIEGDECNR